MIVRDFSPIPYQGGALPITDLLKAVMKYGFGWPAEMKSQEIVTNHLSRSLDNSYTLLRNVSLSGAEFAIPLILVGFSGVTVINHSPARGIFRAQGNVWAVMDKRDGAFRPTSPNLVMRTSLFSRALETYLNGKNFTDIPVEGVLVLTDPGTHVDTTRPDARVVLLDGLKRFAAQISSAPPIMDRERRYKLTQAIEHGLDAGAPEKPPTETSGRALPQTLDSSFDQALTPLRRKANFSRQQWLILGAFVAVEVIILVIFLFIIMFTA